MLFYTEPWRLLKIGCMNNRKLKGLGPQNLENLLNVKKSIQKLKIYKSGACKYSSGSSNIRFAGTDALPFLAVLTGSTTCFTTFLTYFSSCYNRNIAVNLGFGIVNIESFTSHFARIILHLKSSVAFK